MKNIEIYALNGCCCILGKKQIQRIEFPCFRDLIALCAIIRFFVILSQSSRTMHSEKNLDTM